MKQFSVLDREAWLKEAQSTNYDVIIIGGGITGAGILLDAATRGLKAVLFEKADFASGTSSRSTKLIHGGLRYLKQLEFGLVHESGTERVIVHNNAPHIVLSENMLLPIFKDGTLGEWTTSMGLQVYDFLAGVDKDEKRKMLNAEEVVEKEPLIKNEELTGGGIYKEYRTDDARLVIEVLKKAVQYNSKAFNYATVQEFTYSNDKVDGIKVYDEIFGKEIEIKGKTIINATGPWVDELRTKDEEITGNRLQLTKGVHIVVDYKKLPIKQSVYFDVAGGRMIFAIPRDNITYIGTTDTFYDADKDEPEITNDDIDYLLEAVNSMFPSASLIKSDVQSGWAGLRPLIHQEGKSASEVSRKDEIFISSRGLISIAGGKLTGYRKMAERAVDEAVKVLKNDFEMEADPCITKQIKLGGGDFKDPIDIHRLNSELQLKYQDKIPNEIIHKMVFRYGSNAPAVFERLPEKFTEQELINAELSYCIEQECITNLNDFIIRRTGMLFFDRLILNEVCKKTLIQIRSQLKTIENHINTYNEKLNVQIDALNF